MPPIADNLATRIASILFASFAVVALLIVFAIFRPRHDQSGPSVFQLPLPAETAAIVKALEACSPTSRPLVVNALNSSITAVHLEPDFPPVPEGLQRQPQLEHLFASYGQRLGERQIRVELNPRAVLQILGLRRPGDEGPSVELMVALKTGGVVVIEHRPPSLARSYIGRLLALFAIVVMVLLAGLTLAVRQTARPVRRLAEAARRFSIDQAAPDLPAKGPREVQDLAAAFNEMQGRIRALVSERTRLLAAIAHDLRTYMTRLRLRVEFISDEDQRARAVCDIDEMAQLIDDTLLFAAHTGSPRGARDICDAWEELEAVVGRRQEVGEPVIFDGEGRHGGVAPVRCAAPVFRRMLDNLIDNAIKYGERARVSIHCGEATIEVVVEDDGPGVPTAALPTLTQPFLRLESSRARETGGAGLGLTIVKTLVEECRGDLTLSNLSDGGLRAVLTLPSAIISAV